MAVYTNYHFALNSVLMINALVMYLILFITLFIQGGKTSKSGNRPKEDAFLMKGHSPTEDDKELEIRWKRIVGNTLETCPLAFLIFAIATFVSVHEESNLGLIVVIPVFVFCRILYVICYVHALQPWRTIIWMISILCIIVAGIIAVIDAFRNVEEADI